MNIAFFGTSDRSTPILESLKQNFSLILCITKRDEKVGRKRELKETEVKSWSKENGVTSLEILSMKENADQVIQSLKEKNIELGVMADFGFIVPKKMIEAIPKGIINIHFSMLPKYRGASPVQFALLNGDPNIGITYYLMNETMDTGDILKQYEYKIGKDDTSESLYKSLFERAGENISEVVEKYISGELLPLPQDNSQATYTYSRSHPKSTLIYKEDAKIDWNETNEMIDRKIRAYCPWPIAWTTLKDLSEGTGTALKNPNNGNLLVKVYKEKLKGNGLEIELIQVEGKKILNWKEFKNGYLATAS